VAVLRYLRNMFNSVLSRYGFEIVEKNVLYDWQHLNTPYTKLIPLPTTSTADSDLNSDNPRLITLKESYNQFDKRVTAPLCWTDNHVHSSDIRNFRGDNAYLWQLRGQNMNPLGYALSMYYVMSIDNKGLLNNLKEDGAFGANTFEVGGKRISRDLLDSITEIYFLDKHLGLSKLSSINILDIGAGYGRLAHRLTCAIPGIGHYYCTDAVAVSSFICDYYIRYRGIDHIAKMIPLHEIKDFLSNNEIDIAINIHSFSECTLEAINWWLDILTEYRVKFLFLIPNLVNPSETDQLLTNDWKDFSSIIYNHGYRLVISEPKYLDPVVMKYGLNPAYYFLFYLENSFCRNKGI